MGKKEIERASMSVAGRVINELSDKIPYHIIAINELIKNAYDAWATTVDIKLDVDKKVFYISDNGEGMSFKDIEGLLKLSKSNKKYGQLLHNEKLGLSRRVQGSKGLGFLSAFKFGKSATWETVNNGEKRTFFIDKEEIVVLDNISDFQADIVKSTSDIPGTLIKIDVADDAIPELIDFFNDAKNSLKIVNSFYDDNFHINLSAGEIFTTESKNDLLLYLQERKLFDVTYSSESKKIIFKNEEKEVAVNFDVNDDRYKINLNLVIYDFSSERGLKQKISGLFFIDETKISPLVYINDNLFNNINLFDPEAPRVKKGGVTLPQMIGYVRICTDDEKMDFNPDRTNFVVNDLTTKIEKSLFDLNIAIQREGQKIKKLISDESPEDDSIQSDDPVIDTNTPPDNPQNIFLKPEIIFKINPKKIVMPSAPLNLYDEILYAKNGKGGGIDKKDIEIEIDGRKIARGHLGTINEESKKIVHFKYKYDEDEDPGVWTLTLNFVKQLIPVRGRGKKKSLISIEAREGYNVQIPAVSLLINQINSLYEEFPDKYNEVIACSLRAIFDICIDEIDKSSKHTPSAIGINKGDLPENVQKVMTYLERNSVGKNNTVTLMANSTKISFNTLKNQISTGDFKRVVKKAHLASHGSTINISKNDIEDIGKKIGLFSVVSNELLYNKNIV